MSKSTISTFELFKMFPDAEAARVYMEAKRWPDGAVCPACDEAKRITTRKGGPFKPPRSISNIVATATSGNVNALKHRSLKNKLMRR